METLIRDLIKEYIGAYSAVNKTESSWQEPLIGYANARDGLFIKLKDFVSPTHALSNDILNEAETIIAYFKPFQRDIVQSNIDGYSSNAQLG